MKSKEYDYYLTMDNDDGSIEMVMKISGSQEEAFQAFNELIESQSIQFHHLKSLKQWRVIRLFDANDNQLAKES